MNHVGQHNLVEPLKLLPCFWGLSSIWMGWQLSTDGLINLGCSGQPIFIPQDDQDVDMGQASLLELNHPQLCRHHTEDLGLHDIIHQLVLLLLEDSCHQIWPIL